MNLIGWRGCSWICCSRNAAVQVVFPFLPRKKPLIVCLRLPARASERHRWFSLYSDRWTQVRHTEQRRTWELKKLCLHFGPWMARARRLRTSMQVLIFLSVVLWLFHELWDTSVIHPSSCILGGTSHTANQHGRAGRRSHTHCSQSGWPGIVRTLSDKWVEFSWASFYELIFEARIKMNFRKCSPSHMRRKHISFV